MVLLGVSNKNHPGSGKPRMSIVGCVFHPCWQQVAVLDTDTGEIRELNLTNGNGEAEQFYRCLPSRSLIGFEASGNTEWFEER